MESQVALSLVLDTVPSVPSFHTKEAKVSTKEAKVSMESGNSESFVNQAAIIWNDMRKKWVGDASKKTRRPTPEPIISWSTSYEDLLSGNQRFPQPIPLTEMVDFLVDIWHDEGLYD